MVLNKYFLKVGLFKINGFDIFNDPSFSNATEQQDRFNLQYYHFSLQCWVIAVLVSERFHCSYFTWDHICCKVEHLENTYADIYLAVMTNCHKPAAGLCLWTPGIHLPVRCSVWLLCFIFWLLHQATLAGCSPLLPHVQAHLSPLI